MKVEIKHGEALNRKLARIPAVKLRVVAETHRVAEVARGILAEEADGRMRHQIVTRFGVADGYVELDGPAASVLEYGRAAGEGGEGQPAKHIMLRALIASVVG